MLHDISLGCAYLKQSTISLYLGATGSAELMHQMTEAYWHFLVEIGLLDDSPDQNRDLLNLVPALCCVWKEHDWSYIIQHGLYGKLKEAAKRGLVRADGLVVRLLRVCMVLAAASATEECAVLPSMIAMELETLPRVVGRPGPAGPQPPSCDDLVVL